MSTAPSPDTAAMTFMDLQAVADLSEGMSFRLPTSTFPPAQSPESGMSSYVCVHLVTWEALLRPCLDHKSGPTIWALELY